MTPVEIARLAEALACVGIVVMALAWSAAFAWAVRH